MSSRIIPVGAGAGTRLLWEGTENLNATPSTVTANVRGVLARGDARPLQVGAGLETDLFTSSSGTNTIARLANGLAANRVTGVAAASGRGSQFIFPLSRRQTTAPILPASMLFGYRYRWETVIFRDVNIGAFGITLSRNTTLLLSAFNYEGVGIVCDAATGSTWRALYRAVQAGPLIQDIDSGVPCTSPTKITVEYSTGLAPSLVLKVNDEEILAFLGEANLPSPIASDIGFVPMFGSYNAVGANYDWCLQNRMSIEAL